MKRLFLFLTLVTVAFSGIGLEESTGIEKSNLTVLDSSCTAGINSTLSNISYSKNNGTYYVDFVGAVQTPTPCGDLDEVVSLQEGYKPGFMTENKKLNYTLNIDYSSGDGVCIQCLGQFNYKASFGFSKPFRLKVKYEDETVKTLTHPDYETFRSKTNETKNETEDKDKDKDKQPSMEKNQTKNETKETQNKTQNQTKNQTKNDSSSDNKSKTDFFIFNPTSIVIAIVIALIIVGIYFYFYS